MTLHRVRYFMAHRYKLLYCVHLFTEKMSATMKENGVFQGLMYILLLNMSAKLTRELGMAPGGEFRRALAEVFSFVQWLCFRIHLDVLF